MASLLRAALRHASPPAPRAAAAVAAWAEALREKRRTAVRDPDASPLGADGHAGSPEVFLWESRVALALWALEPAGEPGAADANLCGPSAKSEAGPLGAW